MECDVNKVELVGVLADRLGTNRTEANRLLDVVVETIAEQTALTGRVSVAGFGVFEKVHRPARTVRNPRTGERKSVGALDHVRFRPGTNLKRVVAGEPPEPVWASGNSWSGSEPGPREGAVKVANDA